MTTETPVAPHVPAGILANTERASKLSAEDARREVASLRTALEDILARAETVDHRAKYPDPVEKFPMSAVGYAIGRSRAALGLPLE